ncbi:hypothetical protein EYF80_060661 [Liparis tanakae]|uniref:Uncharacterized protein n=1 Tax=Liparis tanakae TaxID=230148 RepID=A0A4Z2ELF4_9TELE|nr:hypothetical protein EYF80_060661 [Liparis tanakae]
MQRSSSSTPDVTSWKHLWNEDNSGDKVQRPADSAPPSDPTNERPAAGPQEAGDGEGKDEGKGEGKDEGKDEGKVEGKDEGKDEGKVEPPDGCL